MRNDDNDRHLTYRGHVTVGVRHLFPSRHYPAVWSRLSARGTMTTTSYRSARRWVFVTFFVEALLCLSGGVLVHAERSQRLFSVRHYSLGARAMTRRWVFVKFFPSGTTLLSGRVLLLAER
ncbi:hypothetical protein TNCV_1065051 [Trichonephila clavipes]|nr:hypothetical protein TNCV_1065051 [Trichonephila clavipes]